MSAMWYTVFNPPPTQADVVVEFEFPGHIALFNLDHELDQICENGTSYYQPGKIELVPGQRETAIGLIKTSLQEAVDHSTGVQIGWFREAELDEAMESDDFQYCPFEEADLDDPDGGCYGAFLGYWLAEFGDSLLDALKELASSNASK